MANGGWYNELTGDYSVSDNKPSFGPWRYCDKWYDAKAMGESIKARLENDKKISQQANSNNGSSSGASAAIDAVAGVAIGAAIGAGTTLVGFGLKGIWKIIVFPFWLIFWMGKLLFLMFKGMFYTFPRFLFRKGKVGRICLIIYIIAWIVTISVYMIIDHIEEKNAVEIVTVVSDISIYFNDKLDGRAIKTIPLNSTIKVLKQNTENGWAKIKFERSTGYIKLEDLNIFSEKIME